MRTRNDGNSKRRTIITFFPDGSLSGRRRTASTCMVIDDDGLEITESFKSGLYSITW